MEVTKRPSSDFTRIFDILQYQAEKYPNASALNFFSNGSWQPISVGEAITRVDAIAYWLLKQGHKKGEKIIVIPVMGSSDWMLLDLACQQLGMITVPVHPTSHASEIEVILNETEATLCVTADLALYEKLFDVLSTRATKPPLYHLVPGHPGYLEAIQLTTSSAGDLKELENIRSGISENEILTILYTSGSSGTPKGVLLTHRNVVHNIKAILSLLPLEPGERVISFLPFSHIFERATCYAYLAFGVSLYFSQNKESFTHDFKTVRPQFCTCVPRVLEKMYDFLEERLMDKSLVTRKVIGWSMEVGKKFEFTGRLRPWYIIQLTVARLLVLKHWRIMLGGKIRYIVVGAASLRPEIGRLFSAAGIQVVEGYGMTETAPLITINRFEPGQNRYGTVGLTISGIDVKLAEQNEEGEGEILVKGPNVTQGYFKKPDLTKEAFTNDGWFKTGDVGKFVGGRFLQITDRKKDIFKTSAGKYIAPQPLQNHFAQSPFIQRCLIIGFQKPFVTALIVPQFAILEAWCAEQSIHWTSPQFMVHNIKVVAKFQEDVDRLNEELPNFQRVRKFVLCHEEWTVERGEITNTLKPVRHLLEAHYAKEIARNYE